MEDLLPQPLGVPSRYKPEYDQMLLDYFSNFSFLDDDAAPRMVWDSKTGDFKPAKNSRVVRPPSLIKFAASIGVHSGIFTGWAARYPSFSKSLERAKEICQEIYMDGALLGLYSAPFTSAVMMNVFGWRTRTDNKNENDTMLSYADQVRKAAKRKTAGVNNIHNIEKSLDDVNDIHNIEKSLDGVNDIHNIEDETQD